MNLLACVNSLFALLAATVSANTEKVIFLAPSPQTLPDLPYPLDRLGSDTLTPSNLSVRKSLPVAFPTIEDLYTVESWYLLRSLNPGQRYEVRICWAAIQPTEFRLEVFSINEILENPDLLQGAAKSSQRHQETSEASTADTGAESVFSLRIQAAAAFFTTNQTLMQHPPPVNVDIILDPYLANIFPSSLLPTAGYICCLAVIGWYISGIIWSFLQSTVSTGKIHTD